MRAPLLYHSLPTTVDWNFWIYEPNKSFCPWVVFLRGLVRAARNSNSTLITRVLHKEWELCLLLQSLPRAITRRPFILFEARHRPQWVWWNSGLGLSGAQEAALKLLWMLSFRHQIVPAWQEPICCSKRSRACRTYLQKKRFSAKPEIHSRRRQVCWHLGVLFS